MKIKKLRNIEFQKDNETFVLTSYNTNKMTLEAKVYEKDKFIRNRKKYRISPLTPKQF